MKHSVILWAWLLAMLFGARVRAAETVLVNHADVWRYRKGTSAVQADWKTASEQALDASWATGNGGFGYADNAAEVERVGTRLPDMENVYTTVFARRTFQLESAPDPTLHLVLTMDWDDGFIAWLDGVYLASANAPSAPVEPMFDAQATGGHESSRGGSGANEPKAYDFGAVGPSFPWGPHVLAVVGLNQNPASSDFILIADLALTEPPPPAMNPVSGSITADTTWRASNSVYTVTGDLTVANGATLTIEPGVTVWLEGGVHVTVENGGRLLAEGTGDAPIQFMRPPGAASAWGGIVIRGQAGSPETRIVHANLEGNGDTCIEVAGGTLWLDNAAFGTTTRQYVSLDDSSFVLSHCYFPSSTASFELVHGTGGIKAGGRGIVRRCFFGTANGYRDVIDFTGGNRPDEPIIQLYNNVFVGTGDDILDLDGTDAWIEGNLFLHAHKNGGTPDSAAGVSGGDDGSDTSEITVLGNIFYDCDNAATAKQGNFFTLINNTIVRTTKAGGVDTGSGVVCVRDLDPTPTSFGRGFYLEGNVVADAEQLVRNYDAGQSQVTFNNNLLPKPWAGPGSSNVVADPLFKHVPGLSETYFTNWLDAQILREWFSLLPGSPAIGSGPNGLDQGADIPMGASVAGEPTGTTAQTSTTLKVGVNRVGAGIPSADWPNGSGYTHYKWRLDSGSWSEELPIETLITLNELQDGPHYVEVAGKRDSGFYQDDPVFGEDARITRSGTWTVATESGLTIRAERTGTTSFALHFVAEHDTAYVVQFKDTLDAREWSDAVIVPAQPTTGEYEVPDLQLGGAERFYRVVRPTSGPTSSL